MTDVNTAAVAWIARHLQERWPHASATLFSEVAENLDAIAREYEIPAEAVIEWVHLVPRDGEASSETFRAWAQGYALAREQAREQQ